jgi:hypothetical protein
MSFSAFYAAAHITPVAAYVSCVTVTKRNQVLNQVLLSKTSVRCPGESDTKDALGASWDPNRAGMRSAERTRPKAMVKNPLTDFEEVV